MNRQKALKVINIFLPVLVIWQLVTAFFRIRIGYETFEKVHFTGGILLGVFALVHLILNWNWVKNAYFKR